MRRKMMWMLALAVIVIPGCGWSPTADKVFEDGLRAVALDRDNWGEIQTRLEDAQEQSELVSLDALFTTFREARDQLLAEMQKPQPITEPTTRPAGGPDLYWLSDEWLAEQKASSVAKRKLAKENRAAIAADIRRAQANVDIIEKRMQQMNRLRRSWGPNAQTQANTEYMIDLMEAFFNKPEAK